MEKDLKQYVCEVDDFPEKGIKFYDIAPLLGSGAIFAATIREMAEPFRGSVDKVVGFDARGFLFGAAMAHELGVGVAMLRKPGKLPGDVTRVDYDLEYGTNSLELQADAVGQNERIVLVDDVIATGGTALAGIELVRFQGATIVGFSALIDLPHLGGSKKIAEQDVAVRALMELGE